LIIGNYFKKAGKEERKKRGHMAKNKCAFIRKDIEGSKRCPFGLPIPEGCEHAGDSVSYMCPAEAVPEDKGESVEKANKRVYIHYKTDSRCLYASNIIRGKGAVNCNFGDTGAGTHIPTLSGSPLYPQTFSGIGLDGLYAFPLGFYADNNESRNLFQGLFSLVGSDVYEIIKEAVAVDELLKSIAEKLENNEPLTTEEQLYLTECVSQCRQDYEGDRTDSAKAYELAEKWNPRKRL
jgi:hypothetical protein